MNKLSRPFVAGLGLAASLALGASASEPGGLTFDRVVIDDDFPGAYQVEVADVNGDGKPDVVAVGGGTCAWYENPSWKKRRVSTPSQTPGIISSATRDLDGDGKAEVAIAYEFAMNEPRKGKLTLACPGKTSDDPWTFRPVADVGSIHRLRWGDTDGDGRADLVVAPIFGPRARPPAFQEEPAHVQVFQTNGSADPVHWTPRAAGDAPVLHAIDVVDGGGGRSLILTASNLGVGSIVQDGRRPFFSTRILARAEPGTPPKVGSSEVHRGRTRRGEFLATIDPWHGTEVAVRWAQEPGTDTPPYGPRAVIDATLKEGHALWVADVDGDGEDEIFAGFRGAGTSVLAFDFNGERWDRTVVDPRIAAQDLRGGDLDGDGRPDVVAVGGSTRNVVWYRPRRPGR